MQKYRHYQRNVVVQYVWIQHNYQVQTNPDYLQETCRSLVMVMVKVNLPESGFSRNVNTGVETGVMN